MKADGRPKSVPVSESAGSFLHPLNLGIHTFRMPITGRQEYGIDDAPQVRLHHQGYLADRFKTTPESQAQPPFPCPDRPAAC